MSKCVLRVNKSEFHKEHYCTLPSPTAAHDECYHKQTRGMKRKKLQIARRRKNEVSGKMIPILWSEPYNEQILTKNMQVSLQNNLDGGLQADF